VFFVFSDGDRRGDPMQRTTAAPDDYLASLPGEVRSDMTALDAAIAPVFAGHERVLGRAFGRSQRRIIGYGDLRQNGKGRGGVVRRRPRGAEKLPSLYVSVVDDRQYIVGGTATGSARSRQQRERHLQALADLDLRSRRDVDPSPRLWLG
jgi:hypothetical protein